ncbi:MAG: hypothetical protein ACI8V2_002985 [Candidatus Latescibacterota bacterium]|jgi:hypothetical protein
MRHLISTEGSDRGTGYNVSNRMLRRDGKLLIGWLDAPPEKGDDVRAMLGVCDLETGALQHAFQIGGGIDNHCGSALVMDANARVHAVVGAHHGPFIYRYSDDPVHENAWSDPEFLGPADTYPSLVVDGDGTLHMAHRERGDRWQLWYRRKKAGQAWEAPRVMAVSPVAGYNHFMQSLTVGPTGDIHLVFQFHFAESGNAADCRGRAAVYVKSEDGGDTWFNEDRRVDSPITLESMQAVCHAPGGGDGRHSVRVGNHVVDADNQPWFFCSYVGYKSGVIWRRTEEGWQMIDLVDRLGGLNMEGGRATSLSRDGAGNIHFAFATDAMGERCDWFAPNLELFYLVLDSEGNRISLAQMTEVDADAANWLPALELWDWMRPDQTYDGGHFLMYTRGLNAGGIGGDNKSALKTEIILEKS